MTFRLCFSKCIKINKILILKSNFVETTILAFLTSIYLSHGGHRYFQWLMLLSKLSLPWLYFTSVLSRRVRQKQDIFKNPENQHTEDNIDLGLLELRESKHGMSQLQHWKAIESHQKLCQQSTESKENSRGKWSLMRTETKILFLISKTAYLWELPVPCLNPMLKNILVFPWNRNIVY